MSGDHATPSPALPRHTAPPRSVSGTILPGVATLLTPVVGPQAFMYVTIVTAALYALFVLYRLTRRDPVPDEDQEPFQQMTGQMPLTAELAPQPEEVGSASEAR